MTRLNWGSPDERYYEDGVDRGVLYVDGVGYVWNGLVSVSVSPSGGESRSYYLDGIKHINLASAEEYEATISAISSPQQFLECDGVKSLYQGLTVTQQKRKPFGFSYRTMIGNGSNPDTGYKIHIVYNALAAPAEKNNNTRSDSPELNPLSWFVSATPPKFAGSPFKPSAHFIIDSRTAPEGILTDLENLLYGSDEVDAQLPTQLEVLALFEVYAVVQVTDNGDGTFTVTGPDDVIVMLDETTFQISWPSAIYLDADTYTLSSL